MAYPQKTERNKEIIRLKDKKGWSFQQIADYFNLNKRTVWDIYQRAVKVGG